MGKQRTQLTKQPEWLSKTTIVKQKGQLINKIVSKEKRVIMIETRYRAELGQVGHFGGNFHQTNEFEDQIFSVESDAQAIKEYKLTIFT